MFMLALPVSMMGTDQKPYSKDPDQIIAKKELFCGNENANKRKQVTDVANKFIAETDKKLNEEDFLKKFEDFWKGRKETATQLAKSTANGDESLEKGTLTVLEETLKKDPQLVEVDDSYIKAYHNANQEANELKNKLDNAEQDVKQKDTEIEALKKQLDDLKKSLEASKTETSDKQKALDQTKAEVAAWQKQKSDADQLIGQQKQQIGDLTSQAADSCKEVDRLNQELKEALETNHEIELKNKDLENNLSLAKLNHQHDNEKNEAEISTLVAQIKDLKDQLTTQKEDFEKQLAQQQDEAKKQLVEKEQTYLVLLAQEKEAAYNRGKVDQQAETQNLVQQLQAMIMSARQPAILAPQTQAQDQANNADSQGANTTDEQK